MDNCLIAKKTNYKYWYLLFLFALIFFKNKISIGYYVFADENKSIAAQRATCEQENRQQYDKLYDGFYDKDTFIEHWKQRFSPTKNEIFNTILLHSGIMKFDTDKEEALQKYFNWLIKVLTTKYALEEYNIQRDESNLKRTQLSSFQTDYSNLQFKIEFLNLFYKTLLELSEKQETNINLVIEGLYDTNNRTKLSQKIYSPEQPQEYPISVDYKRLPYLIKIIKIHPEKLEPPLQSFLAHGDGVLRDDFNGKNKKDLIDFFQQQIKALTEEVVQQNKERLIPNLEGIKNVYAQLIFKNRCTIEAQNTLLTTTNKMKGELVKELKTLDTNYEQIYNCQKATIEQYKKILLIELNTQAENITNRFKDRKPYEICLQQEGTLTTELNQGINDLINDYITAPLKALEDSKNAVRTKISEIKNFIEKTEINESNTASLKRDFDTFNDVYCEQRKNFAEQQAKTNKAAEAAGKSLSQLENYCNNELKPKCSNLKEKLTLASKIESSIIELAQITLDAINKQIETIDQYLQKLNKDLQKLDKDLSSNAEVTQINDSYKKIISSIDVFFKSITTSEQITKEDKDLFKTPTNDLKTNMQRLCNSLSKKSEEIGKIIKSIEKLNEDLTKDYDSLQTNYDKIMEPLITLLKSEPVTENNTENVNKDPIMSEVLERWGVLAQTQDKEASIDKKGKSDDKQNQ